MTSNKYQNGKVYKLTSNETDRIYIGSTCGTLRSRIIIHRFVYRDHRQKITAYEIMKYSDAEIELIEEYPCETKQELLTREKYWINHDDYKDIRVNTQNPILTLEERKAYKQKSNKLYRERHGDKINNRRKERYHKNPEKMREQKKVWDDANRDNKRASNNRQLPCEHCGILVSTSNMSRHVKTKHTNDYTYTQDNKEKIKQRKAESYQNNKEAVKARTNKNYHENKEAVQAYRKQKKLCPTCDQEVQKANYARHVKNCNKTKHIKIT